MPIILFSFRPYFHFAILYAISAMLITFHYELLMIPFFQIIHHLCLSMFFTLLNFLLKPIHHFFMGFHSVFPVSSPQHVIQFNCKSCQYKNYNSQNQYGYHQPILFLFFHSFSFLPVFTAASNITNIFYSQ